MSEADPPSPCISVCLMDDNDICVGCHRSSAEITDWFMASAQRKREILDRCRERLEASSTIRLT